jgi:hypothetical protein
LTGTVARRARAVPADVPAEGVVAVVGVRDVMLGMAVAALAGGVVADRVVVSMAVDGVAGGVAASDPISARTGSTRMTPRTHADVDTRRRERRSVTALLASVRRGLAGVRR